MEQSKQTEPQPQNKGNRLLKPLIILGCCVAISAVIIYFIMPLFTPKTQSVSIPNPLTEVSGLAQADDMIGFKAKIPTVFPFVPETQKVVVIGKETIQVTFMNAKGIEQEYRMSSLKEDVSGIYNQYSVNDIIKIGNVEVTLKGEAKDQYIVAIWNDETYSYALNGNVAMTTQEFSALLMSIQ